MLYCAQDREFAENLLDEFVKETGLKVAEKFDTEANKSVGLYQELVHEGARPRCDVFWNNEILSTIRLQKRGLLQPYRSPQAEAYPDWTRASDGTWQAFAARARVLIINTRLVAEDKRPQSLLDLEKDEWKNRIVMAKPQFGTTATQAACLDEVLGESRFKQFYLGLKNNGVTLVAGNKQVAQEVAAGRFVVGLTDQDDAIIEIDAGKPVAIVFPDRGGLPENPRMGVLLIPNTLSIIKACPNLTGAKKLVDFLVSREVEKQLAEGGGFQIPLNPTVKFQAHPALGDLSQIKPMQVDWSRASDRWEQVQAFLRDEFGR